MDFAMYVPMLDWKSGTSFVPVEGSYFVCYLCKKYFQESNKSESHVSIKKVFVGGIRDSIDENVLKHYFEQFGPVQGIDLVTDKDTGKKRGFAFVTFDDYDTVDKIVCTYIFILNMMYSVRMP